MAVVANVCSVGAGSATSSVDKVGVTPSPVLTRTYKRTLQHYITNENQSSVEDVIDVAGGEGPAYRQGWHWIPYTTNKLHLTQGNIDELILMAKRYRVKKQGFTIKRLQAMQQQVSASNSTTSVSNSFVQQPGAMLFKDHEHEVFQRVVSDDAAIPIPPIVPIWQRDGGANPLADVTCNTFGSAVFGKPFAGFTVANDGSSGTLPLSMYIMPKGSSTGGQTFTNQVDWMNGGDIEWLSAGASYSYMWENPIATWQTPNYQTSDVSVGSSGTFPHDTVTLAENVATLTTQDLWNPPMMHLIRVPPLSDALGNIAVHMELIVEYTMEIEIEPKRYQYSYKTTGLGSAVAGSIITEGIAAGPMNTRAINTQYSDQASGELPGREAPAAKKCKHC